MLVVTGVSGYNASAPLPGPIRPPCGRLTGTNIPDPDEVHMFHTRATRPGSLAPLPRGRRWWHGHV